jgi:tetratricopeptide (TPR) repeat protein
VHGTSSPGAVAAIDHFQGELLRYGIDAGAIVKVREMDPGFALAHALAAAIQLFTMTPAGVAAAAGPLAVARSLARTAPERERMLVEAIHCWSEGRIDAALALHFAIAERWPRDLVSARIGQYHLLNRGAFEAMRRLTGMLLAANEDEPAVLGMHAFALEQTGAVGEAEDLARVAADAGFDPWAEHTLAHVLDRTGRSEEGIAFLSARSGQWVRCSSFLRTHNWWHLALFHIGSGDHAKALRLYDTEVWGVRKAYCHDQVNAVSLLARLELEGVDVDGRWAELAGWLEGRTGEHVNGFLDLHYLYGLARGGCWQAVSEMERSLAANAGRARDVLWREIVPIAASGLAAKARGRPREAADLLGRVLPHLHQLGGSSAQHHLFTLLHRDALARA